ncbi:MAG: protein phosphatase 2C domain-containing protein [Anaerolineae bacterium]
MAESVKKPIAASLHILSVPAPEAQRINEDAWLALEAAGPPGVIIAAVIDGAGARLTLPPLQAYLRQNHHGLTAAAFAASFVRDTLLSRLAADPAQPLKTALLAANAGLRRAVAAAVGNLSPARVLQLAGEPPGGDLRRARLALPAAVVTLARLNRTAQSLEFAHAGDTALLEIRRDGETIRHTADQMGRYDRATLQLAARLQHTHALPHFAGAVRLADVCRFNIENGLRHNYVDQQGRPRPGEGCGVINGLPELEAYIQTGTIPLDPRRTAAVCLHTDGLELPAPLPETPAQSQARLRQTGALLTEGGPGRLFEAVHSMLAADAHFDQYPRLKPQDDATGIYLPL